MKTNLFSIDEDALIRILSDANENLVRRCHSLLESVRNSGANATATERNEFVKSLRELEKELKRARANDGRSFRSATKTVSAFFKDLIDPIEASISSLATRALEETSTGRPSSTPVVVSPHGEVVGEAKATTPPMDAFEERWEIDEININQLDLNLLREFFTEHQIRMAADKHLKAYGPNKLSGIVHVKKLKAR